MTISVYFRNTKTKRAKNRSERAYRDTFWLITPFFPVSLILCVTVLEALVFIGRLRFKPRLAISTTSCQLTINYSIAKSINEIGDAKTCPRTDVNLRIFRDSPHHLVAINSPSPRDWVTWAYLVNSQSFVRILTCFATNLIVNDPLYKQKETETIHFFIYRD